MSDTTAASSEPVFIEPGGGREFPNPLPHLSMDFPGLLKLSGRRTSGVFMVFELSEPPGEGPPPHIHDDFTESFFILEGAFEFTLGDRIVMADQGAFLFVPRGVAHGYRNVGTTVARYVGIISPPVTDLAAQTRLADA